MRVHGSPRGAERLLSACVAATVFGVLLVSGCPQPGPTGSNGNPLSIEQRLAAFDEVQQVVDSVGLDGDPSQTAQIVAALQAMPVFDRVEVEENVVAARFTDGPALIIMNNRPSADVDEATALSEKRTIETLPRAVPRNDQSYPTAQNTKSNGIPKSTSAVLVNTMGTEYCDPTPTLGAWLSEGGYTVTHLDGSIESLRTGVTGVGVLYYSGHGAPLPDWAIAPAADPPPSGRRHFGLWTRTQVTSATLALYQPEVDAGDLSYTLAETDRTAGSADCLDKQGAKARSETHFLITESFIRKHWRCAQDALVYIDACHSAQFDSPLPDVCLVQGANAVNAGVFLGWSALVLDQFSTPSAYFFFDRVLGTNEYAPVHTPPQRPFSTNAVLTAMQSVTRRGLPMNASLSYKDLFRVAGGPPTPAAELAYLVAYLAPNTRDILLRPAIQTLRTADPQGRMTIGGTFSDTPGTASLDGSPLTVRSWTSESIECDAPSGASGAVVVETAEHASNLRRLTQWNLTLRRVFMDYPTQGGIDCPDCFYEATLHYAFTADTAGVRLLPEEEASPPGYTGSASSGDIDVTNAAGSYPIGQGSTITLARNADDGAAFIGTCVGFAPPADNNYLGACFFLKRDDGVIAFSPTISAEGLLRTYTGGAFDGTVDPYQVMYSGNLIGNELVLSLTPNFTITAGNQTTGPNSYFEWDAANATSPAEPDDPR